MPRTAQGALTLADEGPRSPRQRRIAAALAVAVVGVLGTAGYLGVRHLTTLVVREQCQVTASGMTFVWAPDQASNAAAITAIAVKRGLPPRAATIAIALVPVEKLVFAAPPIGSRAILPPLAGSQRRPRSGPARIGNPRPDAFSALRIRSD